MSVCVIKVCCYGRAYKDEVAAQNVDSKNQSYYIVPITIEMRPKFGTKFPSGFLVNPKEVSLHAYTLVHLTVIIQLYSNSYCTIIISILLERDLRMPVKKVHLIFFYVRCSSSELGILLNLFLINILIEQPTTNL